MAIMPFGLIFGIAMPVTFVGIVVLGCAIEESVLIAITSMLRCCIGFSS